MSLTPEQLLVPRYKVCDEGYPDMPFRQHQILQLSERDERGQPYWRTPVGNFWFEPYFDRFPNIFQKIHWWEGRENDMPAFVRMGPSEFNEETHVYRWPQDVKWSFFEGENLGLMFSPGGGLLLHYLPTVNFLPATEAEYLEQQNSRTE